MNARRRPVAQLLLCAALAFAFLPAAWSQGGEMRQILYGEIVSASPAIVQKRMSGRKSQTGATVGAIAGAAIARRGDRWLGGLIGSAIGGAVGRSAERKASRVKGWDLVILLERGDELAIQLPHRRQQLQPGDRVRVVTGSGGADVQRVQ